MPPPRSHLLDRPSSSMQPQTAILRSTSRVVSDPTTRAIGHAKKACAAKGQNAQVTIRHAQKAGSLGMRGMQAATWYNWAGIAIAIAG